MLDALKSISPETKTILTVDWETFYDTSQKYSLSSMTAEAYINDPRFEPILVGVKVNSAPTEWKACNDPDFLTWLHAFPWQTSFVVAHNGSFFDFLFMSWKYGIVCGFYLCTLLMARPLNGEKRSNSLAALAERYGLPPKGDEVHNANGKRLADFSPRELEQYGAYCCLDNDLCYEILSHLIQHWPPYALRWMNLTMRMYAVPQFKLNTSILETGILAESRKEGRQLLELESVLEETGFDFPEERRRENGVMGYYRVPMKKLVGSGDKFADILRHLGVEPPVKVSDAKLKTARKKRETDSSLPEEIDASEVTTFAFARTDPFMQATLEIGDDRKGVTEAVQARVGVKSTIMHSRLTRMKGIAERMGCMPMPVRAFGAHCVPGETEVLTREGWVRLDAWQGGQIMQYTPATGRLKFLPARPYSGPSVENWVHFPASSGHAPTTLGHKVPTAGPFGTFKQYQAADLLELSRFRIIESGRLEAGRSLFSAQSARLLALIAARATKARKTGHVAVYSRRDEIHAAIHAICKRSQVPFSYTHPKDNRGDRTEIDLSQRFASLSARHTSLGLWVLLELDGPAARAYVETFIKFAGIQESTREPGNPAAGYSAVDFATADEAGIFATLLACTGFPQVVRKSDRSTRRFRVSFDARRQHAIVHGSSLRTVVAPEKAWCAETVTGFWLSRYRGKIYVTGNTGRCAGADKVNPQNFSSRPSPSNPLGKANPSRMAIEAPPDHVVVDIDQGQIEVRVSGGLAGERAILDVFSDPNADPYCTFGETLYGRVIIKDVDKFERNVSKSAVLGNGFGQGGAGFQGYCRRSGIKLDLEECTRIVRVYRAAHPDLVEFWRQCEWALHQIMSGRRGSFGFHGCLKVTDGGIILPSGRLQRYPDMHVFEKFDERVGRTVEAIRFFDPQKYAYREVYGSLCCENLTQGAAADVVLEQGVDIAYEGGFYPALQCHDALTWVVHKRDLDRLLRLAKRIMTEPRKWMDWIPLAVEADIGDSYGSMVGESKYFTTLNG